MRASRLVVAGRLPSLVLALSLPLVAGCKDSTGPNTGAIRVALATNGADIDPDGYVLRVDGGVPRTVTTNGVALLSGLEPGDHTVRLEGVATNCSVDGGAVRSVTVTAGREVSTIFALSCVARVGSLRVTTVTSGNDPDPDGYIVEVQNVFTQAIGVSASVTFASLRESDYQVRLTGVAPNCIVAPTVAVVRLTFGAVAEVTFAVRCPAPGSLRVTNLTSGPDPDPNGYTVQIGRENFSTSAGMAAGGTAMTSGLLPDTYHVTLAGVAENCAIVGSATRLVEVGEGATAEVAFDIACAPATRLAFVSRRDGNPEIYTANSNGTGVTRLTNNGADDADPAWSPDGRRIAFASDRGGNYDIYIMDADGSNVVRRTSTGASSQPAWSPDGSRVAFVSVRDGNTEIYVMNADGTNQVRLTSHAASDYAPAWSPDGGRIAFTSTRGGNPNIYVMSPDGSGVARLPNTVQALSYSSPAWSPDGQRIAVLVASNCDYYYYYYCEYSVQILNAAGTVAARLAVAQTDSRPAWSPDGRTVAYSTSICNDDRCSVSVVYARADGSYTDLIIPDGYSPSWRR